MSGETCAGFRAKGVLMNKLLLATASSLLLSFSAAQAATITFDEFAPDNANGTIPAGRYAGLGVTVVGTDDSSTWGGNSGGNVGNWGLEGTNGAAFSGFNGSSYNVIFQFAGFITNFSLDASRSNGSSAGQTLTVEGWRDGGLIDSSQLVLGDINSWSTFSLGGIFDEIHIQGGNNGFSPFGIDNLNWDRSGDVVPEPATWALMIVGFGSAGLMLRRRRAAIA